MGIDNETNTTKKKNTNEAQRIQAKISDIWNLYYDSLYFQICKTPNITGKTKSKRPGKG